MKRAFFLSILLALLLGACSSGAATPTATAFPTLVIPTVPSTPSFEQSCRSLNLNPTPGPDSASLFPAVTDADHVRGTSGDDVVELMVYGDYQGAGEAAFAKVLDRLLTAFPDQLKVIFRAYPQVKLHANTVLATKAAEAADLQGKYWEMNNLLLARQQEWADLDSDAFRTWLQEQASSIGLDADRFAADLDGAEVEKRLSEILGYTLEVQLPGTPILLLNGQLYQGMYDYASLDSSIRLILLGKRQFTSCPPWVIDPEKEYIATLHTEKGDVVIQLYPDKAPYTVNNFVFLAQQGWYRDITFHRVLEGFVAQTGDPSGTGLGGPGYFIINEIDPSLKFDREGVVGMANAGPNTNGSQFFITFGPAAHLDGKYTIFGQVIQGMEVLRQLKLRDPQPGKWLPPGDKLLDVTIEER